MSGTSGRVMFIAAHPDDPDFLAGGTVARLAKEGQEIAYVILTNGNKGSGNRSVTSEQLAPIREAEQRRAAQVVGVRSVEFLGYEDGELEDTRELRRDVTREIRRWRPDLIITLNPHRTYEPRRVLRRLQSLRGWGHAETDEVFSGSACAGRADGA
jgi:LmbE family N-acetylglucosaminyl deacetylase